MHWLVTEVLKLMNVCLIEVILPWSVCMHDCLYVICMYACMYVLYLGVSIHLLKKVVLRSMMYV